MIYILTGMALTCNLRVGKLSWEQTQLFTINILAHEVTNKNISSHHLFGKSWMLDCTKKPQTVHSSTHMRRYIDSFEDTPSKAGVNCIQEKMDSEKQMAEVVLLKMQVLMRTLIGFIYN